MERTSGLLPTFWRCDLNGIYLRHWLGTCDTENGVRKVVNDMYCRYNKIGIFLRYKLFSCQCVSCYGCKLFNQTLSEVEHVCVAWCKYLSKVICLSYLNHNALLPFICDITVIGQIYSKFIIFFGSLLMQRA